MGQRKTSALAYADYVAGNPKENAALMTARLRLLDVIERVYPELLEVLSRDVFPLYLQCADERLDPHNRSYGAALYRQLAEHPQVKPALCKWTNSFHVTSEWLLERAICTLWGWRVSPEKRAALKWSTRSSFYRSTISAGAFEVRVDGWEMEILTWSAYKQSVYREVERKLAEYRLEASERAESHGLIRTPRTYSAVNLDWFVLYQFAGMSSGDIIRYLEDVHSEESAVLKGIKAAAKLLSWEHLREPTRKIP